MYVLRRSKDAQKTEKKEENPTKQQSKLKDDAPQQTTHDSDKIEKIIQDLRESEGPERSLEQSLEHTPEHTPEPVTAKPKPPAKSRSQDTFQYVLLQTSTRH